MIGTAHLAQLTVESAQPLSNNVIKKSKTNVPSL